MIGAVLLCVAALAYYFYRRYNEARKYPPGPMPLPLLGNVHQMNAKRPELSLNQWAKEHGGIVTVYLGPQRVVVLSDYNLIREALVKNAEALAGRPDSVLTRILAGGVNSGVIGCTGPLWRANRRMALHILRDFGFGRQMMEVKIRRQTDWLVQRLRESNANSYNCGSDIHRAVGSIICDILMNKHFETDETLFFDLVHKLDVLLGLFRTLPSFLLDGCSALRHVPLFNNFNYKPMSKTISEVHGFFVELIEQHKATFDPNAEPSDYIDAFLQQRHKLGTEEGEYSDQELKTVLFDLFLAGMETTVTTLKWALLYMIRDRDIQATCRAEIHSVLGVDGEVSMGDKQRLPYTYATLVEVQRRASIVPVNMLHSTTKPVTIGGYTLPTGTSVLPQISAVLHDEKLWPDPMRFDPERFLGRSDGEISLNKDKIEMVCAFSLGKRQCLGESLARMELFIIFVTLLQKFKFDQSPTCVHPSIEPVIQGTLVPRPYELIATECTIA